MEDNKDRTDPNGEWIFYEGTYKDNDKVPGFIDRIDNLKKIMSPNEFARNFMASRKVFDGQVLVGNSAHNCCIGHPVREYRWIIGGYDHGHTHRAGICVVGITSDYKFDVLKADGVSGLMFMSQGDEDTLFRRIRAYQNEYDCDTWFCSHERPENIQTLKAANIPAQSWLQSNQAGKTEGQETEEGKRTSRYLFIDMLLKTNRLIYLQDQKELISDIQRVHWQQNRDRLGSSEKVAPELDDVTDALGMAIWSYKPIRNAVYKLLGLSDIKISED